MDKADTKHEVQSDTSSVINMKEYAPSEYPSSEPPPAYMKPRHNSVRIARLAAFTVLASAVILGSFILAASWIQANTARNLDLTLNQELMDDLHPSYDHLVAGDVLQEQQDNSVTQEVSQDKKQEVGQDQRQESLGDHQEPEESDAQKEMASSQEGGASLELDAIANVLMQKGMRGNVNCIVEKRRNEELVDHAPRAINLPGLNITTPPRLQHLTGEQVVIICKDDSSEEKEDSKEDQEAMMLPLPPQILQQLSQGPQLLPLAQILQHVQAAQQGPQQPIFIPHQQQQHQVYFQPQPQPQQQVYYQPQPQQQQLFYQPQPQQEQIYYRPQSQPQPQQEQIYYRPQPQPQPQQEQIFYRPQPAPYHQPHPQIQQQVFYPQQQVQQQQQQQQQQQMFIPQPEMMYRPQQQQQPEEERQEPELPTPLRRVPLSQLMSRRPINPMAEQILPISQMPMTHMPMREARMPEQPIPVHHLVPPRPQQIRMENFSQDEDELPALIREKLMEREREMMMAREMTEARPRPLPLESREPRVMRGPIFPLSDNSISQPQQPQQQTLSPRIPPPRPFRFPDSEPEGMAITRIIPIRLEKIQENDDSSSEEKRPLPIPLNAILDMVFRGIRPLVGRQPFPVPIDIKIERIQKPMMESSESEESQEESQETQEMLDEQDETENNEDKSDGATEAKVQQVEIVEKEGENTQAIPIPADAQDAQIFKLEEKPEGEWAAMGRAFLPDGLGRGGVFPIPQGVRAAQIFTVSDARAGVPMSTSYQAAPTKEEEEETVETQEPRGSFGQPEGEVNLFPVPINAEQSVRLYPVEEQPEKPEAQPEQLKTESQPEESEPALQSELPAKEK